MGVQPDTTPRLIISAIRWVRKGEAQCLPLAAEGARACERYFMGAFKRWGAGPAGACHLGRINARMARGSNRSCRRAAYHSFKWDTVTSLDLPYPAQEVFDGGL